MEYATAHRKLVGDEEQLENWYSANIAGLPDSQGRLICQRGSVQYDLRLRRDYSIFLAVIPAALLVVTAMAGVWSKVTFDHAILLGAAFLPFFLYFANQRQRNGEA